ncbi:MAG TPA: hypothetical protein VHB97_05295 [Polyangia bacterium]|nr:hypothetical protein [Polyangia bacterium]
MLRPSPSDAFSVKPVVDKPEASSSTNTLVLASLQPNAGATQAAATASQHPK